MAVQVHDPRLSETTGLALIEAPGGDGPFNPDGTVNVVILRPCDGRGPGSHIYPASTLREAAPSFTGLASYLNHEDPKARRAAAKMRRGPEELAGELRETRWDPSFTTPDDHRFGYERGGIVGKFMPATDLVEQLIRRIPGQMKLSINSKAGKARRAKRKDGSDGWLVESIANDPETSSVDLVTGAGAGAGGGVLQLVESLEDDYRLIESLVDEAPVMTLRDALLTPEVGTFIRDVASGGSRPTLQVRATAPKSAAQQYREDLASGQLHRQAAVEREARDVPAAVHASMAILEAAVPGAASPAWRTRLARQGVDLEPFTAQASQSGGVRDYLRSRGLDPADFGLFAEAAR
jgi:hypothetical protein